MTNDSARMDPVARRIREIENKIACNEVGAPWVFTQMRQLIRPNAAPATPASASEAVPAWLSWDEACVTLWKAIEAIKLGNKTDDKLILRNLREAGIWLARSAPASGEGQQGDDVLDRMVEKAWSRFEAAMDVEDIGNKHSDEMGNIPQDAWIDFARDVIASQKDREASKGDGQQGDSLSPMAKMAEALRAKSAAERSEFEARVQAGEWGPMPAAGTQSDFCRACDGTGWDGESRVDVCLACNGGREKATQQQAGQAVACNVEGSWLWVKLMDWCKAQGIAPGTQDALFRIASEAHQQYTTPQTPDGYVLVPREPTEAMTDAAMDQPVGAVWGYCGNRDDASLDDAKRVWAAMIAASEASGGENAA